MEDREVDEGDWRGLSKGEAETESITDESVVGLRRSAARLGIAVDDMAKTRNLYSHSVLCLSDAIIRSSNRLTKFRAEERGGVVGGALDLS